MFNSTIITGGTVIDILPNASFQVELDNGLQIKAEISEKLRNSISIGNRVTIQIPPIGFEWGEIMASYKQSPS